MLATRVPVISSLWLIFFINGAVLASWAPRIPEVKDRIGLSDADLGIALLGIAFGAVPAMLFTARTLRRVTDLTVCAGAAVLFPAALPLIDTASSLTTLTGVLVLLGAASGALDVSMNALAVRLQETWRTRILGRLHGAYSLGVLAGTAGAAVATHLAITISTHFLTVSAALVIASVSAALVLLTKTPSAESPAQSTKTPRLGGLLRFGIGPWVAASIGVIAIGGFLLEGLVTDWSALLLRRDLAANPTLAASVLSLFSVAMFVSRSASDAIMQRVNENVFLLIAALAIGISTPFGLLAQSVPMVVAGIFVTGLCVGPLFPLALARGARAAPTNVARMTASLSVVGYAAYLGGPPLIGFSAEHTTLPSTFTTVTIATAVVLIAAAIIGTRVSTPPDPIRRYGAETHDNGP